MVTSVSAPDLQTLRGLDFFEALSEAQLGPILNMARFAELADGEALLRQGEGADAVGVVVRGKLRLSLQVKGRPDLILGTLARGQLVGWSGLMRDSHWVATASALRPSTVLILPRADLNALCEADSQLGWLLMSKALEAVSQRLHDTRLQLLDMYGHG